MLIEMGMKNDVALSLDSRWQIWYQDTFDRGCPRQIEVEGTGIIHGLVELWTRHLYETVQAGGGKGFSHFNLWLEKQSVSIQILGEWAGQVRVREWVYGKNRLTGTKKYKDIGDRTFLKQIAEAHLNQIIRGATSEAILTAAITAPDRVAFDAHLLELGMVRKD